MWVLRTNHAPRGLLGRRISLLVSALVLVLFAVAGPLMKSAAAAGDTATWSGSNIQYNSDTYTPTTAPPPYAGIKGTTTDYQYIDTSANPNIAHVIYFSGDLKAAQAATSATIVHYEYAGNKYGISESAPITVTPLGQNPNNNTSTAGAANSSSSAQTSCSPQYFGSLGWLICSASSWIANGVDGVYNLIKQFLQVDTINQSNNGVFAIWQMILTLANISFVIIFLIIIYSQLTSIGISNYSIKDMLPRLVIAAILVNFSFWICQFFVDISNVLGYSIEALFIGVQQHLGIKIDISWTDLTTLILSGGTIATGALAFAATAGGSFASLGFILLGALISAGLAVLVAFVILAARQAIIVILVMLAPLAFVAMVLPSTKELFEKWRKTFQTLLVFFPIFAMLFGGSQLAGAAIIKSQSTTTDSGSRIAVILIGLAIQVMPLFITPLIIRFSEGFLGRIAGMANDRKRGLVDRAKGWTQSNADDFKMRKLANAAKRRELQRPTESGAARVLRGMRPSNTGLWLDQSKRTRERRIKRNGEALENASQAVEQARINDPSTAPFGTRTFYANQRQRMIDSHGHHKLAELHGAQIDADADSHWAQHVDSTPYLRNIQRQTALTSGTASVISEDLKARDELAVSAMINANHNLRSRSVNTGIAKNLTADYKASIDAASAEGHLQIQHANQDFRQMRRDTDLAKKRTADIDASMTAADQRAYDTAVHESSSPVYKRIRDLKVQTVTDTNAAKEHANIVQKDAEAHWQTVSRTDPALQTLRLQSVESDDKLKKAETQWSQFVEESRALGDKVNAPAASQRVAASIKQLAEDTYVTQSALERAQQESKRNIVKAIRNSKDLQVAAGGIDEVGAHKVLAKVRSEASALHMENVKAYKSVYSNEAYSAQELMDVIEKKQLRGEQPGQGTASELQIHAAIQRLMSDVGNNWAVQKVIDWSATLGMEEENGVYSGYDNTGNKITLGDVDSDEVTYRRDMQQIVNDAYNNSKISVGYVSATQRANMESGTYRLRRDKYATMSEQLIVDDSHKGKYDAERISTMDPDELSRMVQVFRDPKRRDELNTEEKAAIVNAIQEAQTNPNIKGRIKPRERGIMNVVAAYLDPRDTRSDAEKETVYFEYPTDDASDPRYRSRVSPDTPDARPVDVMVETPNIYEVDRQNDYTSGSALKAPDEKK